MVDRITVSGFRPPRIPRRRRWRWRWLPRVAPIQARNLLWLVLLAAMPVGIAVWGTPHMLLSYTYVGPDSHRVYQSCTYIGLETRTVFPYGGRCPLIRFFKSGDRS